MAEESVRFGILGCGKIAKDFATALKDVKEAKLVAVGSRSKESATQFGETFGIDPSRCYATYEELAKADEIDLIYIASPHSFHYEHSCLCLNNNKNVLCEKAVALNAKQVQRVVDLAKEKNLFFMEALWTRYIPCYQYLTKHILPELGDIRMARATFGFVDPGVQRLKDPTLGGGALLDIGVYCVNFCNIAFADRPVEKIQAIGVVDENNIDSEVSASLVFKAGESGKPGFAQIYCTFGAEPPSEALIVGENGYVRVEQPFWCSTKLTVKLHQNTKPQEINFAKPFSDEDSDYNFTNSVLLQYEARYACEQLLKGAKESEVFGMDDSVRIMKILDEMRAQVGVSYPNESV